MTALQMSVRGGSFSVTWMAMVQHSDSIVRQDETSTTSDVVNSEYSV